MKLPVVVLAGGLATRLGKITEKKPKSLIDINGIPFVLHQLKLFQINGIDHVHYCLGYHGNMIEEVVQKSDLSAEMKITYSYDGDKLLGTGGAIKNALFMLPEAFFIIYGDSFLDIDYQSVEKYYYESANESCGLMVVYKNSNRFDTSNVIFEKNRIVLYSKKRLSSRMKYIDYGLGILRKFHFNATPDKEPFDLSEIYEKLSVNGGLLGYETENRFYEIGSLKGIEDLSNYLITLI